MVSREVLKILIERGNITAEAMYKHEAMFTAGRWQ